MQMSHGTHGNESCQVTLTQHLFVRSSKCKSRTSSRYISTATHCNTLQHAAVHCNTLQYRMYPSTYFWDLWRANRGPLHDTSRLQHTATHCNILRTLQHTTPIFGILGEQIADLFVINLEIRGTHEEILVVPVRHVVKCVAVCCGVLQCHDKSRDTRHARGNFGRFC